jgi:hypothetical protein
MDHGGIAAIACVVLGFGVGAPLLGLDVLLPVPQRAPAAARTPSADAPPERAQRPVRRQRRFPTDAPVTEPRVDETWQFELRGRGGRPVPGARLRVAGDPASGVSTDEHGRAAFDVSAGRESVTIEGARLPQEWVTLTERHTVLQSDAIVPVEVRVIDALSGETLALPSVQLHEGRECEPVRVDGVDGRHAFLATLDDEMLGGSVSVHTPDGYVVESDEVERMHGAVSVFARSIRLDVPVRRECTLRIRVEDADGRPAPGAAVRDLTLGGRELALRRQRLRPAADAGGEIRLRGIPYLRGEALQMTVGLDGRTVQIGPVRLLVPGPAADTTARLPADGPLSIRGGSESFRSRSGCGRRVRETPPPGDVRVEVRRRDGSPAARARVRLAGRTVRLDELGVVSFDAVPEGTHRFTVCEPGFVHTAELISVRAGECAYVSIDEAPGRTVDVLVVDHEGAPVPFARLDVQQGHAQPYALLDDRGVQHLTLYTDAYGECVLSGLPSGRSVHVAAEFGSRKESAEVVGDLVTITLPEPR